MGGAPAPPVTRPNGPLDVAVAPGKLRHDTVAVGRGARDAAQGCLQLKLVDLVLHVSHAVAGNRVQKAYREDQPGH